jgi:hypothetical protein
MAAFFALIAGLAIGTMFGMGFVGYLVASSVTVRDWFKEVITRIDLDLDI